MRLLLLLVIGFMIAAGIVTLVLIPMAAGRGGVPWAGEEKRRRS